MKIKLLAVLAVVVFAATSCGGHRTCATYLKNTKEVKSNEVRN